jgi:hypothetical protein
VCQRVRDGTIMTSIPNMQQTTKRDMGRILPKDIDPYRCLARKLYGDLLPGHLPRVYREKQCNRTPAIAIDSLCNICKSTKARAGPSVPCHKTRWYGLITEEPYPTCHMLGTEWAATKVPHVLWEEKREKDEAEAVEGGETDDDAEKTETETETDTVTVTDTETNTVTVTETETNTVTVTETETETITVTETAETIVEEDSAIGKEPILSSLFLSMLLIVALMGLQSSPLYPTIVSHWNAFLATSSAHWNAFLATSSAHWNTFLATSSAHWDAFLATSSAHWDAFLATSSAHWDAFLATSSAHWNTFLATSSAHWNTFLATSIPAIVAHWKSFLTATTDVRTFLWMYIRVQMAGLALGMDGHF